MYRYLYQSDMNHSVAINFIEKNIPQTPERDMVINFVKEAKRGIMKGFSPLSEDD